MKPKKQGIDCSGVNEPSPDGSMFIMDRFLPNFCDGCGGEMEPVKAHWQCVRCRIPTSCCND